LISKALTGFWLFEEQKPTSLPSILSDVQARPQLVQVPISRCNISFSYRVASRLVQLVLEHGCTLAPRVVHERPTAEIFLRAAYSASSGCVFYRRAEGE
jgi:hypothetical protein